MFKELVLRMIGDHYYYQKMNYVRYLVSRRQVRCAYKPVLISIVSTSRCTLSCDMCPTHSRLVPADYRWRQTVEEDMSFDVFKKAVDRYREALTLLIIGSGEPVLIRDFFKMVEYARKERKMEVKTFTNGTTIRAYMDRFLDSYLDGLTVSINSPSGEDYARLTGMPQETFHTVYRDTRELVERCRKEKRKLSVKLSFIIDRVNYRLIPAMIECSRQIGPDHTFFCNFLPCPFDGLRPGEKSITTDDREIADLIRSVKKGLPPDERKRFSFPSLIDTHESRHRCDSHFKQIRVDGAGNIASCAMMLLNMQGAGRLEDEDAWNSDFFMTMRKRFLAGEDIEELCLYCPFNKGVSV
ncbi:MAG: radical SAM protein [Candidatus Omnitrophica bacterium]|nr:radical SAM protein [Candidatus Omnitrophota bacterium]